jgi:hypothetical protein
LQSGVLDSSRSVSTSAVTFGCAYLHSIQAQLECFSTTGGKYLEAIFTHRAVFHADLPAHRFCATGFSDIAQVLATCPGRSDRHCDVDAVAAFRYEAWVIASSV